MMKLNNVKNKLKLVGLLVGVAVLSSCTTNRAFYSSWWNPCQSQKCENTTEEYYASNDDNAVECKTHAYGRKHRHMGRHYHHKRADLGCRRCHYGPRHHHPRHFHHRHHHPKMQHATQQNSH